MKKIGLFLVCVMMIFATSGCGKKRLICSTEKDGIKTELKLNFDSKKKFDNGTMTMDIEAPKNATEDDLKKAKENLEKTFKNQNATVKIKDKKLVVTYELTKDDLNDYDISGEATYDSVLKEVSENEDIVCKKK